MTTKTPIHIIMQGKGGVGKTVIAWLFYQHQFEHQLKSKIIDIDPVNATFSQFKAIPVKHLAMYDEHQTLMPNKLDAWATSIIEDPLPTLVDGAASTFVPLLSYMIDSGLPELFADLELDLNIHVPIAGGPAQTDTLGGLASLIKHLSPANFYIWLNFHSGLIEHTKANKKLEFQEMKVYQDNQDRIAGIIRLPKYQQLKADDLAAMLKNRHIFSEVADHPDLYSILSRSRLKLIQQDLFATLDQLFVQPG